MENTYRTRELSEAAVLLLKGQHLLEINRIGKISWFVFEDKRQCEKISNEFFFGELLVNARTYYETITRLKGRIFAGQK
jgi:hypothetical protein